MRILTIVIALVLVLVVAAAVFFRVVPMPADVWHVDPATVTPPDSPNFELRASDDAPVIPAAPGEVAARLDTVARAEGGRLIAGSLEDGHATYVLRSRLMGYPDAVSVRISPEGEGTRVEIFSRSRFGYSDMGVNAARVARWLDSATAP